MPRESVEAKAHRYLAEGRLTIRRLDHESVVAEFHGGTVYRLGGDADGWWCECPARGTCAHLTALRVVTGAGER